MDQALFELINKTWSNNFFDILLPLVRNKFIWYPLYVLLIGLLFVKFSEKKATLAVLFLLSVVAFSDLSSSQLFKKSIQRLRPCQDDRMEQIVIQRVNCSYSFSFPSSHATNHFAIASFYSLLIGFGWRAFKIGLYCWAGIISYAQIYVGVHYPFDVFAGMLLGIVIARLCYRLVNRYLDEDPIVVG